MRRFTAVLASSLMVLGTTDRPGEAVAQGVRGDDNQARTPVRVPQAKGATPARAPAVDVDPGGRRMDRLLVAWEGQSRKLKSLEVMIYRKDVDPRPSLGGELHFQGTAKFETPNRAYIAFDEIKIDKKTKQDVRDPKTNRRVTEPYERIKCTGKEVWQYKFDSQQIFIYPLNKEEQAHALDEGPLPFLFNMKADEARNRYDMVLLTKEDSKAHLIKVRPKLAIDREDFGEALVELEKEYLLPTRIVLFAPDRSGTREYFLSDHSANPKVPIDPRFFQGVEFKAPWKTVRNPQGEDKGLKGKAAAKAPRGSILRRN